jgi:hypothetical protein
MINIKIGKSFQILPFLIIDNTLHKQKFCCKKEKSSSLNQDASHFILPFKSKFEICISLEQSVTLLRHFNIVDTVSFSETRIKLETLHVSQKSLNAFNRATNDLQCTYNFKWIDVRVIDPQLFNCYHCMYSESHLKDPTKNIIWNFSYLREIWKRVKMGITTVPRVWYQDAARTKNQVLQLCITILPRRKSRSSKSIWEFIKKKNDFGRKTLYDFKMFRQNVMFGICDKKKTGWNLDGKRRN